MLVAIKYRLSGRILALVSLAGLVSLSATGVAVFAFRRALNSSELLREKHAEDLILCHELPRYLERKLAKSRSFLITGDESLDREMRLARKEFASVLGQLLERVRSDEGHRLLIKIREDELRHHDILVDLMAKRRRGARPRDLAPVLTDRLNPIRDEIDLAIRRLVELKEVQMRLAGDVAEASLSWAKAVSAGAALSTLLIFSIVLWLVRRLAAAQSEVEHTLRQANAELDLQVAERTRELSAFNRELEAFSYSIAHDLRTPLRAITNYGELAASRAQVSQDAELKRQIDRLRSAGLRMSQLIDSLLSLSRLTRRPLNLREIDISALASDVGAELAAANPSRKVDLTVQPDLKDIGDPDLLRVAILNLMDNAWKFTAHQTDARVEFGRVLIDDIPSYFVRDNGTGFDERFVHKLFTAFERLHTASEYPGTGIGLATVERVVHRHGGTAWAEGRLGDGATFYFTLNRRVVSKERVRLPKGGRDV